MSNPQIKLRPHKLAYDVGSISNHCRRTLLRYSLFFKKSTAFYTNKEQDYIQIRSCSCILIRTNTFHLKTYFNSKSTLQYIRLRTVRHVSILLAVNQFTIFIPEAAQKLKDNSFINIRYSTFTFRPTLAIFKEVDNKSKIMDNYVTVLQ